MPSSHLILSSPSPPPFNLSHIMVFPNGSVLHIRWPKDWSFRFSISPSSEYSGWTGLISLQSKGLSRVLQHHSSKASILLHSAFLIVGLSHSYMTTGKTVALTKQTYVGKVMSLLFNMLSRFIIDFLFRSKRLNFMATITICIDFGAPQNSPTLFPLFPHLFPME